MAKVEDCPGFETFGADVKAARKAKHLTRKVLAEIVGIEWRYHVGSPPLPRPPAWNRESAAGFQDLTVMVGGRTAGIISPVDQTAGEPE